MLGRPLPAPHCTTQCRAAPSALLDEAATEHLEDLAHQLLVAEGVAQPDTWRPVLVPLAKAAAQTLSPVAAAIQGSMDPRFFIKVRPGRWLEGWGGGDWGEGDWEKREGDGGQDLGVGWVLRGAADDSDQAEGPAGWMAVAQ